MKAWARREAERAEFLEKLHKSIVTADNGGYEDEDTILIFANLLLETIIEERCSVIETTNDHILRVLDQINRFALDPAEAAVIKHRLLGDLLHDGFQTAYRELRNTRRQIEAI